MFLQKRLTKIFGYGVLRLSLFLVLVSAFTPVFSYTRVGTQDVTPGTAYAATSTNLNFQGRLLNGAGNIVPDGFYNLEFKLYRSLNGGASAQGVCAGGGTDDCLWYETYYDSNGMTAGNDNRVRVVNGYFSVNLGSLDSLADEGINWDQDLWLTMNVGGSAQTATPTWDGEMSPRTKLTSVPFALAAQNVYSGNQTTNSTNSENVSVRTGDTAGTTSNTGNITLQTGNASDGNSGSITLDVGTASGIAGTISVGVANASQVTIGSVGVITQITGDTVLGATAGSGTQFTNNGSTVNSTLQVANDANGGPLGGGLTATQSVDTYTSIAIDQTTPGQDISLPSPTNTAAGRIMYVLNTGTEDFTMHSVTLYPDYGQLFIWDGTSWRLAASGGGDAITLQAAYIGGNTIDTTNGRNIEFTLTNTASDANFLVDIAAGSTGRFAVQAAGTDVVSVDASGQLQLSVQGNSGGLLIGSDASLYRDAANSLQTESFKVGNSFYTLRGADVTSSGQINNLALTNTSLITLTGTSPILTGIANGTDGRILTIINGSNDPAVIRNDDTLNSSAGNLIYTGTGSNLTMPAGSSIILIYDTGSNHWRVVGSAAVSSAGAGAPFVQGGNTFGTNAELGTNDNFDLIFKTNNVQVARLDTSGNLVFSGAATISNDSSDLTIDSAGSLNLEASTGTINLEASTLQFGEVSGTRSLTVETRTTNAAGSGLTVSGGAAGAGASAFTGGTLTLQGGAAAGTGNANGANVVVQGGSGVGTGVQGLVSISSTTFTASPTQTFPNTGGTLAQTAVDNFSTIPVTVASGGPSATVTLPAPTQNVVGRILYLTALSGTKSFTVAPAGGVNFILSANASATFMWNGTGWTNAGVDSGSASFILNQNTNAQTVANFWISGTGRADGGFISTVFSSADITSGGGNTDNVVFRSGNLSVGSGTTGSITIQSGDAPGGNRSTGNVVIDAGIPSGSGTAGTLSIGTTNASAVTIGRTGLTTTNSGALTVAQLLTGQAGATVSGGAVSLNASSNFNTSINTGTSTGTVSIGNGAAGAITVQSGSTFSFTGTNASLNTAGQLQLPTQGNTGGLVIGGDVNLYRSSADVLRTDDSLRVGGDIRSSAGLTNQITLGSDGIIYIGQAGDTNLYRSAANTLTTDDSLSLLGTSSNLTVQGTGTSNFAGNVDIAGTLAVGTANAVTIAANGLITTADDIAINGGDITTTAATFNIANGATTINVGSTAVARSINIGTGSAAQTITLGSTSGSSSVTIDAGTGNIDIGTGAQARSTNIATGSAAQTVTLGSTSGASSLTLQSGTGNIDIGTTAQARSVNIATGSAVQALTLGSVTGASSVTINAGTGNIDIGTTSQARTVNLGTGSAAQTVNVGSTNGASTTNINAGTGGLNVTGSTNFNNSIATKKGADYSLTGSQTDVTFASDASLIRFTGTANLTVNGIANGRDGKILSLVNTSAFNVVLANNTGANGNRIITGTGSNVTIQPGGAITLIYDDSGTLATSYWRITGSVAVNNAGAGAYFLQEGNNFGSTAILGTNDNFALQFETNGTSRAQFTTAGDLEFLAAATLQTNTGALTIDAADVLNLGTTDATAVSIGKSGATTTVNGSLTVAQLLTGQAGATISGGAISLTSNTGSNITLTTTDANALVNILTGNLKVGNGTPTVALDGEDAYIEGTLEVDGNARLDANLTVAGTTTLSGNVTVDNNANITQTGTGTFSTGTGNVTLNGNTSITGTNTLTVGTGATTLGGTLAVTGISDFTGSVAFRQGTNYSATGTQNNIDFGDVSLVRLTGASTLTITGIDGGRDGEILTIVNAAAQAMIIANQGGTSDPENRIITGTGQNVSLAPDTSIILVYDNFTQRWRVQGSAGGTSVNTIGAVDTQTPSADGAVIVGNTLYLQYATNAVPGLVSTGVQTFAGDKTFEGTLTVENLTNIDVDSTTALVVENAGTATLTVDTTNGRVAIGTAAPANGVLTVGTNTTTAAGGIYFGTDTTLYRNNVGSLATSGNLGAGGVITALSAVGANIGTSNQVYIGATADSTPGPGIVFGLNSDTNLYRLGLNSLATDDSFTLVGTGSNFAVQGTGTSSFAGSLTVAGTTTLSGNVTVDNNANITQTGTGTFSTGTGNVTLNGNTSITGTNTLTVGTGATTLGGTLAVTGISDFTGSIAVKAGANFSATGQTDNASFADASLIRLTGASTQTITGIAGGRDGRLLTIVNAAAQSAVLTNNDVDSDADKRIVTGTGADIILQPGAAITLVYDATSQFWRVSGGTAVNSVGDGAYILQGGNTFGAAVTIGSNDNNNLVFETNGTSRAQFTTTGDLEFLAAATLQTNTGALTVDAATALNLGTTDATSVSIGRTGITTTNNGALTVAELLTGQAGLTVSGGAISLTSNAGNNISLNTTDATSLISIGTGNLKVGDGTPDVALNGEDAYIEGTFEVDGMATFGSSVGIGTTTPTAELEVVGDIVSDGTKWTLRTGGSDEQWQSLVYGNGLYVAVGLGGEIMISPDGINWDSAEGGSNDYYSVTYGNGLFVAVGENGNVRTSPNGTTWTARSAASSDDWNSVTYGNGLFVAVSVDATNRVMTSPNGITWTARSAAGNDDTWNSVTYGNGLFVAVGSSGDRVMTSSNGTTWTARSAAGNDDTWNSVTYGNGLFVAVGSSGDRVMTSSNGTTWTARSAAGNDDTWNSVTYGNGLFVAVGSSGDRVMTSPDGTSWTPRTAAAANQWREVVYGNGLFVAVSQDGNNNQVMTSGKPDYITIQNNNIFQGGIDVRSGVINLNTSSADAINIGTGTFTGAISVGGATSGTLSLQSASSALNAIVINASNSSSGIDIDAGTGGVAVDSSGAISLDSTGLNSNFTLTANSASNAVLTLQAANSGAGTASIELVADENVNLTVGATGLINVLTGNLKVGDGTPDVALNGEDAYIEGTFEVDGNVRFDGSTVLGDNSADTLTITGTSVSLPNNLNFDSDTLYIDAVNNRVGIGTTTPGSIFDITQGMTATAGVNSVINANVNTAGDASGTTDIRYLNLTPLIQGSNNVAAVTGVVSNIRNDLTSGTINFQTAYDAVVRVQGAGNTNLSAGYYSTPILTSTGSITDYRAFESGAPSISGSGTIANAYGLYLNALDQANVGNAYGVYQAGANDVNYFNGNVGIGTTPTADKLVVSGATTISGGTINLNVDGSAVTNINSTNNSGSVNIGNNTGNTAISIQSGTSAISIGTGNQGRSISIGTGAADQDVAIGSTSAGSTLSLLGADSVAINGAAATNISLGSSLVGGAITIGGTAQTGNIDIGTGTAAQSINLGTGAAAKALVIGSTSGTSNTIIQGGSTDGVRVRADGTDAFRIQSANGATTIFDADVTNTRITIGGASTTLSSSNLTVSDAEFTTRVRFGTSANGISFNDGTASKLRFTGSAQNDVSVRIAPEYSGAVLTGDGSNNIGTMTSDFCSGSGLLNIPSSGNPCGTNEDRNYYSWTANSGNDYDIYLRWRVPSDFASFDATTPAQFFGWKQSGSETLTIRSYESGSSTVCSTGTLSASGAWTAVDFNPAAGGCSIAAGDTLVFRISMAVGVNNNFVRAGDIVINYKSQF